MASEEEEILNYLSHNTIMQSITSSEICALHLTHPSAHTPGAANAAAPGEQLGVWCLAQGSYLVVDSPAGAEIRTHNLGLQVQSSIQ